MQTHDITDIDRELARRIAVCLRDADRLGLTDTGIYLDRALVALIGTGLPHASALFQEDFSGLAAASS